MWDRTSVENVFWPIDVEAVMQIPIPSIRSRDKLIWNGSKNDVYSVKTGYELACHLANNSNEGTSDSKSEVLKKLWNTKVPQKTLPFAWRLLHRAIPTANNLRRRNITVDPICSRCKLKMEDEKHCFIKCISSVSVWELVMPGNVFVDTASSFIQRLEHQILSGNSKQRSVLFITLYTIWLSRNQSLFEGKVPTPHRIASGILERLDGLCTDGINHFYPPVRQPRSGWIRPSPGTLKVNFDASFLIHNDYSSGGMVVRNSDSEVLVAGCFELGLCLDAKHDEAKAAMKAMDVVLMMGYKRVTFDGDCKVLMDEIRARRLGFEAHDIKEVEDLINGFLLSSNGIDSWELTHSRYETNSLAHHLAARRRTLNSDTFYFCPVPDWLANLACCDVTLSGNPP